MKGHLIASFFSFALMGIIACPFIANALDKEFALDYAKQHHLNPKHVRAVNSESECKDNERFESNYGLCLYVEGR